MFTDSGVTQLRGRIEVEGRLSRRLALKGTGFLVRTVNKGVRLSASDQHEQYDVLRLGGGLSWRLAPKIRPFALYEADVAGMNRHADRRISIGVAFHY